MQPDSRMVAPLWLSPRPKFFYWRSTDHHCHSFGVRQHSYYVFDRTKIADRGGHNGVIVGKRGILHPTLFHHGQQHWSGREELLPMPLDKVGRRCADAHNQLRRVIGKRARRYSTNGSCGFSLKRAVTANTHTGPTATVIGDPVPIEWLLHNRSKA